MPCGPQTSLIYFSLQRNSTFSGWVSILKQLSNHSPFWGGNCLGIFPGCIRKNQTSSPARRKVPLAIIKTSVWQVVNAADLDWPSWGRNRANRKFRETGRIKGNPRVLAAMLSRRVSIFNEIRRLFDAVRLNTGEKLYENRSMFCMIVLDEKSTFSSKNLLKTIRTS